MSRPEYMVGAKGVFHAEQVRAWRNRYARRAELLRELRQIPSAADLAKEAGVRPEYMRQILRGDVYAWVKP